MSYVGATIEIPFGQEGLTGTRNLSQVRPGQLIRAANVTFEGGTIQKEAGAAKYNATPITGAPSILGGWDWWPAPDTQRMVVLTSAGTLLKDSGTTTFPTTLATGLSTTGVLPVFVEAGKEAAAGTRKLFLFTGRNAVRVLTADGVTAPAIATPPTDWTGTNQPVAGAGHEGRLWGAGNASDPHRWYYSTPDNHEVFTGTGSGNVPVYPGEQAGIMAGVSFKGLLVTFKTPRGIYLVDTTSPTVADWKPSRISTAIGLASPLSWCLIDDDLVFMDTNGSLHLISAVTEFGNVGTRNLSQLWDLDQWARDQWNLGTGLATTQGIFYAAKRQIQFAIRGLGSPVNSRRLILYSPTADRVIPSESDRDVCTALWLRRDGGGVQRPMMGDTNGTVWALDADVRSKAGLGYTAEAATGWLDGSHADPAVGAKRKNGQFLECVYEPRGEYNLYVDVAWDGRRVQTIPFNMGPAGGAVLGSSFVLGSAVLGTPTGVRSQRRRMIGSGYRIQLTARNAVAGQDFSIAKFRLGVGLGDEAQRARGGAA